MPNKEDKEEPQDDANIRNDKLSKAKDRILIEGTQYNG